MVVANFTPVASDMARVSYLTTIPGIPHRLPPAGYVQMSGEAVRRAAFLAGAGTDSRAILRGNEKDVFFVRSAAFHPRSAHLHPNATEIIVDYAAGMTRDEILRTTKVLIIAFEPSEITSAKNQNARWKRCRARFFAATSRPFIKTCFGGCALVRTDTKAAFYPYAAVGSGIEIKGMDFRGSGIDIVPIGVVRDEWRPVATLASEIIITDPIKAKVTLSDMPFESLVAGISIKRPSGTTIAIAEPDKIVANTDIYLEPIPMIRPDHVTSFPADSINAGTIF